MRWHSFRVRLTLWNVGVLVLLLAGVGTALAASVQANVARGIDRQLVERTGMFRGDHWVRMRDDHFDVSHRGDRPGPDAMQFVGPLQPGAGVFVQHRNGIVLGHGPDDRYVHGPGPPPGEGPGRAFGRGVGPGQRFDRWPGPGFGGPPPDSLRRQLEPEAARLFDAMRPRLIGAEPQGRDVWSREKPLDEKAYHLALGGTPQFTNLNQDGHVLRVFSRPLTYQGKVVAVAQVAQDASELDRLRDEMLRTLLLFLPLAMVLAALGGLFLTDRALKPVRAVTLAAAHISAEDMSQRLTVTGRDELADLAATFNGMLARLEEAFQRLESAYEQLRRFTADVSHELRTPLTRLKGSTSLALSAPRTEEQYRKALVTADQAADAMTRLVQDLLLLARSDAGQLHPTLYDMDLCDVLRRAAAPYADIEGPRLYLELPERDLHIAGDSAHLERLFQNLLENAYRHTPAEGRVVLAAALREGQVEVRITDTGEGISPEHLPHVLERFYRVDAARNRSRGGTGLGLAIVQSIVQSHNGTLAIASEPGRGTTVSVRLPLRTPPELPEPLDHSSQARDSSPALPFG